MKKYYLKESPKKYNGKFFNLRGYFDLVNMNPFKESGLLIITATRNMGKTYGTWDYIVKEIWEKYNFTKKIIYIRTNQEKLKKARSTFNSAYGPKYVCVDTIIYKLPDEIVNQEGKDKMKQFNKVRNNWIEIGRMVDIMNEHNVRSGVGSFENYHFAFWDEFNENTMTDRGLFEKFIMLFSTMSRQNKPFFMLIVGNKIQANNDIFTSFELDTNHSYEEDFVQEIEDDIKYIDIGINTFKHLNPDDSLVNRLARYNINTNNVFNIGGFMVSLPKNIIYKSSLGETELINYFTFRGNCYEYGHFLKDGQLCYYISQVLENDIRGKYRIISLDLISHINNKKAANLNDKEDYIDLAHRLTKQQKNDLLYFTSFDAKNDLELTLMRMLDFFNYDN